MYEDLIKQQIIVELKKLVKEANEQMSDVDSYSDYMREMILNTYGSN